MYDELVKRLRVCPNYTEACVSCPHEHDLGCRTTTMHEAADAIESTSKAYQMMAEAYESEATKCCWIPVTERLPENIGEEVLVCNSEYGKSGLGFVTVAIYDGSDWLECWERKTYLVAVTHWMPLPEPPREEN